MNILLPKEYSCYDKDGELIAEVKDGILYLYRFTAYNHVMYDLTYKLFGKKCVYCGKKACSIDHRIPQDFGGPTITNNLRPTCKSCNNRKTNMMEDEYKKYLTLNDSFERKQYLKSLKPIQEDRRYGTVKVLPQEWIAEKTYKIVSVNIYVDTPLGAKYKRLLNFFTTYKKHKHPIIISGNGVLLDGFNTLFIGKLNNRHDYYQIVLDNVIVDNN